MACTAQQPSCTFTRTRTMSFSDELTILTLPTPPCTPKHHQRQAQQHCRQHQHQQHAVFDFNQKATTAACTSFTDFDDFVAFDFGTLLSPLVQACTGNRVPTLDLARPAGSAMKQERPYTTPYTASAHACKQDAGAATTPTYTTYITSVNTSTPSGTASSAGKSMTEIIEAYRHQMEQGRAHQGSASVSTTVLQLQPPRNKRKSEDANVDTDAPDDHGEDASATPPPPPHDRRTSNTTLPLPIRANQSSLSTDHVIARGRRRRLQLATMTEEQKAIEAEARMVKNRQIAQNCRARKKIKVHALEEKVQQYEADIAKQAQQIAALHELVARLKYQDRAPFGSHT